jgi:hypothetical protein
VFGYVAVVDRRFVLAQIQRVAMATAVCGSAIRAVSDELWGFVKIKPVAGQSPLISVSQLFVTERGDPAQQGGGRL